MVPSHELCFYDLVFQMFQGIWNVNAGLVVADLLGPYSLFMQFSDL